MNKIIKIIIYSVLILAGFSLIKNGLTQSIIAGALSKAANVPVHIGSTHVQIISTTIDLKNVQIHNPRSYAEKIMIDAPEIYMSFDLPALFKGTTHFREVKLNLKELIVIKNAKGEVNVIALKPKQGGESESNKAKGQAPKLSIDKLSLTIGRVVYKDYSQGGQPSTQIFDVNIQDRQYTHIENIQAVVSLIMFEALTRTSLSRLAGLDVSVFKDGAGSLLSGGFGLVKGEAGDLQNTAKGLLNLFK